MNTSSWSTYTRFVLMANHCCSLNHCLAYTKLPCPTPPINLWLTYIEQDLTYQTSKEPLIDVKFNVNYNAIRCEMLDFTLHNHTLGSSAILIEAKLLYIAIIILLLVHAHHVQSLSLSSPFAFFPLYITLIPCLRYKRYTEAITIVQQPKAVIMASLEFLSNNLPCLHIKPSYLGGSKWEKGYGVGI